MYRDGPDRTGVSGAGTAPARFVPWGRRVAGAVVCAPAVGEGLVVVADTGGWLHALDAITGARRWALQTADGEELAVAPVLHNGTVYVVAGERGGLLAVDAATGGMRWSHRTGARVTAPPAAARGLVFVLGDGPLLHALRAGDGRPVWACPLDGHGQSDVLGSPPAFAGGSVYVAGPGGSLHAIDAGTGEPRWQRPLGLPPHAGAAVAAGRLFVSTRDDRLLALDVDTGGEIWRARPAIHVDGAGPAVAGGLVIVAGRAISTAPPLLSSGAVEAYDTEDGSLRWRRPTAAWVEVSPAVGHGRVTFATRGTVLDDAEITSVGLSDGSLVWRRLAEHRSPHPTDASRDGLRSAPVIGDGILYMGLPSGSLQSLDAATGIDAATPFRRWRMRRGRRVGTGPPVLSAHLVTAAWAIGIAVLCGLVTRLLGGSNTAALLAGAASPVVMVAAEALAGAAFRLGVWTGESTRLLASVQLTLLALLLQLLVPPARPFAGGRVRAWGNLAWATCDAGLRRTWLVVEANHRGRAHALARRFPGKDTTVLRAQAEAVSARGYLRFGVRERAAAHAARSVDLYLLADAFHDPELRGEAIAIDTLHRDLAGS
jgi:outer membrane protein assembly factor BamB